MQREFPDFAEAQTVEDDDIVLIHDGNGVKKCKLSTLLKNYSKVTASTVDLVDGTSPLPTGELYVVYNE